MPVTLLCPLSARLQSDMTFGAPETAWSWWSTTSRSSSKSSAAICAATASRSSTASTGPEGLAAALDQPEPPQVIVLDVMLPGHGRPGGLPPPAAGARDGADHPAHRARPRRPTASAAWASAPTTTSSSRSAPASWSRGSRRSCAACGSIPQPPADGRLRGGEVELDADQPRAAGCAASRPRSRPKSSTCCTT